MPFDIIVAINHTKTIGIQGEIPWHLPEDLKHFQRITMHRPVIMGRKTFESIGKPLTQRTNIVLTRNANWHFPHVYTAPQFEKAVQLAKTLQPQARPLIIGGANLYATALEHPEVQILYLTVVKDNTLGDVLFPMDLDTLLKTGWTVQDDLPSEKCHFYTLKAPK